MEYITDADYAQAKRIWKDFEIKNVGEYLWFVCSKQYIFVSWYIWGLLEYVYQIYGLEPVLFLTTPRLIWKGAFKWQK